MPQMRLSTKHTDSWASNPRQTVKDTRPMSTEEFQTLCYDLGLHNNLLAAKTFGTSWRTAQRYWYGEQDVPGPLARLLRLAVAKNLTYKDLLAL